MSLNIILKIANLVILSVVAALLAYAWLYAIPEQTELFKQCEEKILCQRGILKGQLCKDYEKLENIPINFTTSGTSTTSIPIK